MFPVCSALHRCSVPASRAGRLVSRCEAMDPVGAPTRSLARMGRLLPIVVVLTLLALATGSKAGAVRAERIGVAGVSVVLPPGWHAVPRSTYPSQNDPVTRIAASSGPIRFGRGCGDLDYVFPPTGVAIVVLEWVRPTPGTFAPRPRRFTATTLPVRPPPALECFNGPGGGAQFSARGRRFAIFVLLGRRAPASLASQARAVLDTLEVARRA